MALTKEETNIAVWYNAQQSWAIDEIKIIQRVVSAKADGVWGPKTIRAVAAWQEGHGIPADGKVWRDDRGNTWPLIQKVAERWEESTDRMRIPPTGCEGVSLGCWVDDKSRIQQPEYMDKLVECGMSSIALMLDSSKKAWDPEYTPKQIEAIAKLAEIRKMEIVFTTWPFPDKAVIDDMCKDVHEWLGIAPSVVDAFEIDTEFNWKPKFVRGFPNIDKAGDYLVKKMQEATADTSARMELTTFTSHTENGRAADVAPHMHRLLPQAYSVRGRHRSDGSDWKVPWSHTYGPGQMQKHTLDRTMQVPGVLERIEIGCGLAAYDQQWPGHTGQEAMKVAFDAAVAYGCREIRYWSFKWIVGHIAHRTPYAAHFLKELAKTLA